MNNSDVVQAFAGHLHHGQRITIGLMDNQKLKGEFLGVIHDRLVLRPDRDRTGGTLPIRFRAIHSIKAQRGGQIERPR
jgi:hypothetical protein